METHNYTFKLAKVEINDKLSDKHSDFSKGANTAASTFYSKSRLDRNDDMLIEQTSVFDTEKYVWLRVCSLMETACEAFANHYPLGLKPDDFWKAILYGFAMHVDKNAEQLRSKFVAHEGKKQLSIEVTHFSPGNGSTADWEKIFPQFSEQIQKNIVNPELHSTISGKFSTTTVTDQACHEIALMSAMKNYFSYKMYTKCGIPEITLFGQQKDWQDLYDRTKKLSDYMLPEFSKRWLHCLLPVLQEFIDSFQGNPNKDFWNRMIKIVKIGKGSGSYSVISGWINLFYPFLVKKEENTYIKKWKDLSQEKGPEPEDFPQIMLSVPVIWNYLGKELDFHFHGGIIGALQDKTSKMIIPNSAWIVTRDK